MVVDARGLPCPKPVLKTKEALDAVGEGVVEVLVDSEASRENVKRFAERQGCTVEVRKEEGYWRLLITKGFTCQVPSVSESKKKVLLVLSDSMGEERELGDILIRAFFSTLKESSQKPDRIILINRGVFLTTQGSKLIDVLKELEELGIEIYSCGTCLDYFGLKDKLMVGKVTNMYDTVEALMDAEDVVRL